MCNAVNFGHYKEQVYTPAILELLVKLNSGFGVRTYADDVYLIIYYSIKLKTAVISNFQNYPRAKCLTQMLDHFDDIFEGFTGGEDTDSIYLDYVKAFDKVDLDLFILKLKKYGFGNKLVDWIQSFLSDREQVVVLNGVH